MLNMNAFFHMGEDLLAVYLVHFFHIGWNLVVASKLVQHVK